MKTLRLLLFLMLGVFQTIQASQFHVTTTASSNGNGSSSSPWQLQVALSQSSLVKPGDIVYIHQGTYYGSFRSDLTGSSTKPIIVRNYGSDRATITTINGWDDGLQVNGSYVWFWGIEFTSDKSCPLDQPGDGINLGTGDVDGIKVINCVIHDVTGAGIGCWSPSTNSEINGCLIYYNGRMEGYSNDAHDYGMYVQNVTSNKLLKDNIDGYNWSYGVHAYSESGGVNNITFDGNVFYNAGYPWLGDHQFQANFLIGGLANDGVNGDIVRNCHFYYSYAGGITQGYIVIGCDQEVTNFSMTGCTFTRGGGNGNDLWNYSGSITGNTFYGSASNPPSGNTVQGLPSSGTKVVIRKNDYELGRANVIIYNWPHNSSVNVDFSSFLAVNSSYTIRDAQNYYGPVILSGTYKGGTVSIPMNNKGIAPVVLASGQSLGAQPFNTQPEFGAFIVTSNSYVATVSDVPDVKTGYNLEQNYPNPFNPTTCVEYSLQKSEHAKLVVCNILGQMVYETPYEFQTAGQHAVTIDGSRLASGTYLYTLQTESVRISKRMVLLK